ncbi:MAG: type VI secretion system tip protein VgrG, partial [Syntrophus sp. (in: bacteria)]
EVYLGEGSVPFMLPGFTFTLENHYRKGVNQNYLITDIDHEGNQTGYLLSGVSVGGDEEKKVNYRNYFTAIPGSVQFRPEAKAEKPKISGTISGMIDAAGSGQYAELDPQGRYKIVFPFDLSGRSGGKASNWVRMAQPYVGSDHGMHFPLHKGTEVLITFIDGDPDRPIISGAVPNPETPSRVSGDNQSKSRLVSASGNEFHMEDAAGSERILLNSPKQQSFIRIGAPNDPSGAGWNPDQPSEWSSNLADDNYGFNFNTAGQLNITAGTSNEIILGEATETVVGLNMDISLLGVVDVVVGENFEFTLGDNRDISIGNTTYMYAGRYLEIFASDKTDITPESTEMHLIKHEIHENKVAVANLKTVVDDDRTEMATAVTIAIAESTKALATHDEVIIAKSQAISEANNATAVTTGVIAEQMNVLAAQNTVTAECVETIGSQVKTVAEVTKTIAAETKVIAEATEILIMKVFL